MASSRAGGVGFDLGQNGIAREIGMMDLRIEHSGDGRRIRLSDQAQSAFRVDRRLVLREHDQGRSALIQPWIHPGGDFGPTRESQTNVNAVTHLVGGKGPSGFRRSTFR